MLKNTRWFVVTGAIALAALFAFPEDSEARHRRRCCRVRHCHARCDVVCQPRVVQDCEVYPRGAAYRPSDGYGDRAYRPAMGPDHDYGDRYYRDDYGW